VIASGKRRTLKVHSYFFIFNIAPNYLRDNDIAGQLQRGDIELYKPLGS
jgi:hypothetical protein